jgi:glutamate-1-semialdehyde aminotransferase
MIRPITMSKNKKISKDSLLKGRGQQLYKRAKELIPGGTQLLSKRPEMFAPDLWPSYYSKAKGSKVWDLDNNEFLDMSIMGVGACILGYADEDVDNFVMEAIKKGVSSSLNSPYEVELAEKYIELHPWFDMVRYCRSGGEAVSLAVRIARAKTKKDIVLFSGYHGWSDWYLAANLSNEKGLDGQLMPGLEPNGVPRGLTGTSIPFEFNDIDIVKNLIKGKEAEIAAIIVEPARGQDASISYLKELKELSQSIGAVLIFDEITSGFRICPGGIHRKYEVYPDMAVFAKSMANGYAMSAIFGTENVMQAAQSTFISSTNWTDAVGPAAALATLNKYMSKNAEDHIIDIGNKVKNVWQQASDEFHLPITISGLPTLGSFSFNDEHSNIMNTNFVIEMLKNNILGFRQFKPSLAHSDNDIETYKKSVRDIFEILSQKSNEELLSVDSAHSGFSRLVKE